MARYLFRTDLTRDHGSELQGLKAIAVLVVGAIFATTVSPCATTNLPPADTRRFYAGPRSRFS